MEVTVLDYKIVLNKNTGAIVELPSDFVNNHLLVNHPDIFEEVANEAPKTTKKAPAKKPGDK